MPPIRCVVAGPGGQHDSQRARIGSNARKCGQTKKSIQNTTTTTTTTITGNLLSRKVLPIQLKLHLYGSAIHIPDLAPII